MIPSNVVSFMKKMVSSPETGQEQTQTAAAKLIRFKQTLTTGLQQAQDSVARFSAKRNSAAEVHMAAAQQTTSETARESPTEEKHTLDIEVNMNRRGSMIPPDRSVTCRVCVRNLSAGDVAHRVCSQCQLKVCEDCASYSVADNQTDQALWRCSVCRRKNQSASRPIEATSAVLQRSDENLARSLPETSKTVASVQARRRDRCPRSCGSDETEDAHRSATSSSHQQQRVIDDSNRERRPRYAASSTSPSESSLEESDFAAARPPKSRDVSAFLSIGDADRESSDSSDASCLSPVAPSRDEIMSPAMSLLATTTSTRRKTSFRAVKNKHFCDLDVSDGYDADEQSGTIDSSPSPASSDFVPIESFMSPRRSRGDISRTRHEEPDLRHRASSAQLLEVAPRIIIDDVDSDRGNATHVARLLRDPAARPRPKTPHQGPHGFGLSVVGGKRDANGHLYAVVASVDPGGVADRAAIRAGDYVLFWDGVRLTDLSFEEVQRQLEHSGDCIEVQFARGAAAMQDRPAVPSPTRRRLPQAPVAHSKTTHDVVFCRLQLKVKLSGSKLSVGVVCAEEVYVYEDENLADAAYVWVQVELVLPSGEVHSFTTDQVEGSVCPRWNSLFVYQESSGEDIVHSTLRPSFWEETYRGGKICLAETKFELGRVSLDGRSVWYPLKESGNLRVLSPVSKGVSQDFHGSTDDIDDDDSSSGGFGIPRSRSAESNLLLLHPDAAMAGVSAPASLANSRRGSANLPEVPHPRSLPPSRRGSAIVVETKDIHTWDQLKAADLERMFQNAQLPRRSHSFRARESDHSQERHLPRATKSRSTRILNAASLGLGPGQVDPLEGDLEFIGQLKLGVIMAKGRLEVEVVAARNLPDTCNKIPPDTFVKVYLSTEGRLKHKRETRIMRQTNNPQFHQALVYEGNQIFAQSLVAIVCHKPVAGLKRGSYPGLKHSDPIGVVEILLDRLPITTLTMAWYRLIPPNMASVQTDSLEDDAY